MWRVRRLFISLWLPEPTDKSDWKRSPLTLILLTWSIWWAPNNASKRQKGFSSVFKGLRQGKPPATIKFTQFFKFSTRYFCAILNTFRIASTDFHEVLLSNFTKIPWGGGRADTCWETKLYEEANLRFSQLREWAYKQERKCTRDVTLRRVRVTIAAVKKQQVLNMTSVSVALRPIHT